MINILHCTPWPLGGATTYVVQLAKTFEAAGIRYRVVRLAKRTENTKREIGNFGVYYQNVTAQDALRAKGTYLLASAPTDEAVAQQCVTIVESSDGGYVFHDPNEFRIYPHWKLAATSEKIICIREQGQKSLPQGVFIPHPYVRVGCEPGITRKMAVSIARTSAVKNSDWILAANQRLREDLKVDLRGEVNRMWWNFNVKPKHPEWPYPEAAGFPRDYGTAVRICNGYRLMVDLTIFKNDGGGTQYSLLEAMDGGAVPVMTAEWCSYEGVAKALGFKVKSSDDLYDLLMRTDSQPMRRFIRAYQESNFEYLARVHDYERIAGLYAGVLL